MTVTLTPAMDLSRVKMKWREVYVSEGLNRKLTPTQAPGIYRGLTLAFDGTQGVGERRVAVTPDPDTGDHAAVYQTQDGFSLTYFDPAGSTILLDLADPLLDNQETVIAMLLDYTVGADSTGEFHAYTVADYNALTAGVRGELVVLGTVNVPASGVNVSAGMINFDRRRLAWEGKAKGAIAWTPVMRNPGFEWGTGATSLTGPGGLDQARFTQAFWETYTASGAVTIYRNDLDARTGGMCMDANYSSTGVAEAWLQQHTMIPVVADQLIQTKVWIDVLKVSTAGSLDLFWEFRPVAGGATTTTTSSIDTSGVTGGYALTEKVIPVPSGDDYALVRVGLHVNGMNVGSTGVAFRVDDFQCWLETPSVAQRLQQESQRMKEISAYPLMLDDPASPTDNAAPMLRFDSGAGQLIAQRRDQTDQDGSAALPPELSWFGTIRAGEGLQDTVNDLLEVPRFAAKHMSTGGPTSAEMTLVLESLPDESTPNTQPGFRIYVARDGGFWMTWNARWDDSANVWSADTDSYDAAALQVFDNGDPAFNQRWKNIIGPLPVTWGRITWEDVTGFKSDPSATANNVSVGRQLRIGGDLLADAAAASAVKARIATTADDGAVSTLTLLWRMQPNTGSVETRFYVENNGNFWMTQNARWTGSAFLKDNNANGAIGLKLENDSTPSIRFLEKPNDEDTAWSTAIDGVNWHTGGAGTSFTSSEMQWSFPDFVGADRFAASNEPASTTGFTNTMTAINIVKCWGVVTAGEFTGPVLQDGFNISSITDLGSTFQVNIANDMINNDYCIVATFNPSGGDGGTSALDSFIQVVTQAVGSFELEAISHSGSLQSNAGGLNTRTFFAVIGEQ